MQLDDEKIRNIVHLNLLIMSSLHESLLGYLLVKKLFSLSRDNTEQHSPYLYAGPKINRAPYLPLSGSYYC